MAKWICTVCNYVHEGETPPDVCPVCGATKDAFIRAPDDAKPGIAAPDRPPKDLEEVRDRARAKLLGICAVYPACNGDPERMCQREAYGAPIGLGGAGSGASFSANYQALARLRLKTSVVGEHFEPRSELNFFGVELGMPVMGASTAGPGRYTEEMSEREFCLATIRGCREAGTIAWRGDTFFYTEDEHPGLDALAMEGGFGVPIFKPRGQDALKRLIERAERLGCPAVGVDLDGCGSTIMARHGQPVFRKSAEDIRDLVASTSLPFIVKGIMTPEDAEACAEAGVKLVAVSNHGGRVLDSTPGVAEVLPSIAKRVGSKVFITADGGVRTGYDVLKMLALGADAVLIGRDVIRAAVGGGAEGVTMQMSHLSKVLHRAMFMTGCQNLDSIGPHIFA